MSNTLHRSTSIPAILIANALPVYGAAVGSLNFFQVLYLYWLESLFLIFFQGIRIVCAGGKKMDADPYPMKVDGKPLKQKEVLLNTWGKIKLMLRYTFFQIFLLGFYLIFIIAFIMMQVTDKSQRSAGLNTIFFGNFYFNLSLIAFMISAAIQLITGFFTNGSYRQMSPWNYINIFGARTIIMHVMIVTSVFIHQFFFAGKSYAAKGEIVYVLLFMLARTVSEMRSVNGSTSLNTEPV